MTIKQEQFGENFSKAISQALNSEYENALPKTNDIHIFSEKFTQKMDKLVRRQKKPYYKFISTAGRRCACIVAGVLILSASSLSVRAVRNAVSSIFIKDYSDHAEITADLSDTSYPETIECEYKLGYIPDGYEQTYYYVTDDWVMTGYERDGIHLAFHQYTKDVYNSSKDNEHCKIYYYTDDDGQEYLIQEADNGDFFSFLWDDGDYMFTVDAYALDKDTVLKLCRSVMPVE